MSNHPNRSKKIHGSAANPTPEEIVRARKRIGFTQALAASAVYTTTDTWKKWEAGTVRMHPAIWELFRIKTAGASAAASAVEAAQIWELFRTKTRRTT